VHTRPGAANKKLAPSPRIATRPLRGVPTRTTFDDVMASDSPGAFQPEMLTSAQPLIESDPP
jgi:hypothetical protein